MALLFVVLGFAAIYVVAKVADVKDGAVLAAVLIVPALLYLMLSGRLNELKGPAGLEVRLSEIANQTIPVPGEDSPAGTLAYEELREVETGRRESFLRRIRDITPEEPVILTVTLGSDSIDGSGRELRRGADAVPALQVRGGPRLGRARAPDLLHGGKRLPAPDRSGRHRRAGAAQQHRAEERGRHTGISRDGRQHGDARDEHRRRPARNGALRINALLVTENGRVKGIVERERLANALLISLVDPPSS